MITPPSRRAYCSPYGSGKGFGSRTIVIAGGIRTRGTERAVSGALLARSGNGRRDRTPGDGADPPQDGDPSAVGVGHVEQPGVAILIHFPDLPVGKPPGVARREIVPYLARQEGVGDVPGAEPLLDPRRVEQTGRAEVEPRMVDVSAVRGADKFPGRAVNVVGDMGDAQCRNDLGVGKIRDVDNAA